MGRNIIAIESKGKTRHLDSFFKRIKQQEFVKYLHYFGQRGMELLTMETPVDTGRAALSWGYTIDQEPGQITLTWTNSDIENGVSVVVLIQYGHATKNGGYVQPYDFVNPIVKEQFELIADTIWKEVTKI